MNSRIEKLLFSISLIDRASGPANRLTDSIDKLTKHAAIGTAKIAAGGLGLAGIQYTLQNMLGPVSDVDQALAEVSSLGVSEKALQQLERQSLSTSISYGENAQDIIRSSYDIQSAIAGLSGKELAEFTRVSTVLAKGTKADAQTITNYLGTMYGIFQNTADAMGKSNWVELVAGQTASVVQMYKTTGAQMSSAFGALGAEANSAGIAMHEQMAILGTLQATMSGSEAATKYRAFLSGVGNAQKALGLEFVDSQGKLLPMIDVLVRLQSKFGAIDTVAKSDALAKAFGSKEAVSLIKLLLQNTNKLESDINSLGQVMGMEKAAEMASKMIDPWEQMEAAGFAVKAVFGRVMEPVLLPLINLFIEGGQTLLRWTEMFPNLTRVVGTSIMVIMGLVGAVSVFAIMSGVVQLAIAGFHSVVAIGSGLMLAYRGALWLAKASIGLFRAAVIASTIHLTLLNSSLGLSTAATWLFSKALWANPMTWVVLGVVALIGALTALALNWDKVTLAVDGFITGALDWLIQKWSWLRQQFENNLFLRMAFAPLYAATEVIHFVLKVFEKIPDWWRGFKSWFTSLNPFSGFAKSLDSIIQKINLIPGVEIGASLTKTEVVQHRSLNESQNLTAQADSELKQLSQVSPSLSVKPVQNNSLPSITKNISTNNQGVNVEKIEVNTSEKVDGFMLADQLALAMG